MNNTVDDNRLGEVDMGYGYLTAAPRDAQIRALIAIHGDFDTDFDIDTGLRGDDLTGGGRWSEDQRDAA